MKKHILTLLFCLASFTGFAQLSLNTHVIPTFTGKNQAKFSFTYYHKPELHAAYSLSEKWAVSGYWSHGDQYKRDQVLINDADEVIGEERYKTTQKLYFVGVHNFHQRPKGRVFDLAFGLGYTARKNTFQYTYTNGTSDSMRIYPNTNSSLLSYIQPSISKRGKHVGYLVSLKATPSLGINHNINTVFLEPVFGLNFGGEAFRFETQTGVRLTTSRDVKSYRYFHWSVGLSYSISGENS